MSVRASALPACRQPTTNSHDPGFAKRVNLPPVAYDGVLSARAGFAAFGRLAASDVDGDVLTYVVVTVPSKGDVELTDEAVGAYTYAPSPGAIGADIFEFMAHDGEADSNIATVSVSIVPAPGSELGTTSLVSGFATYDYVPARCGGYSCALDYSNVARRPIRGAVVQIVDIATDPPSVAEQTATAFNGGYRVAVAGPMEVRVLVLAETLVPAIRVEDNTNDDALFALQSETVMVDRDTTVNLHAPSGWSAGAYRAPRSAAPFAILDALFRAAETLLASHALDLPLLRANWSSDNRPEPGKISEGQISTSHWDGTEMYLLGLQDVDTDEYDLHVIVHEWAHYFETTCGRSDSLGGAHGFGQLLEPRVAFSEGWANASGAMVLHPDRRYVDTWGRAQQRGFSFDLEDNDGERSPGWFSEWSVQSILYDLFDSNADDFGFDTLSLGVRPLIDVMLGPQRNTPALTTVFSFIDGLKRTQPWTADAVDDLCARHSISSVADAYATGETHDGGVSHYLPVYHWLRTNGEPVVVTLRGSLSPWRHLNELAANRYVRFRGNDQRIRITADADGRVDLYLYRRGDLLATARGLCSSPSCVASVTVNGTSDEYVLVVQSFNEIDGEYTCSISVETL